jgi:hypothetical protein
MTRREGGSGKRECSHFENRWYWSSTVLSEGSVWSQYFVKRNQYCGATVLINQDFVGKKDHSIYVRPVRTITESPKSSFFVVEALRWGDRENHSYVIGVFTTREQAELAGEVEVSWRANKYEYHISEFMLDFIPADKLFHHKGVVPDA